MKFKVSQTFSDVTPESAKQGDFSDTGFEFQDVEYTLRELIDYIKSNGFYREGGTGWLTQGNHTSDYSTGTETTIDLHIKIA